MKPDQDDKRPVRKNFIGKGEKMGFDGFTVRATAYELEKETVGCRVEKVLQPSKDEIYLQLHGEKGNLKLAVNGGASSPRIGITVQNPENPKVPPMFCMLLRKHLTGARITHVSQTGFERVIEIVFETYDEMGFRTNRRLITEIMGRYSNIILCKDDGIIISILRPVDFTTSSKRQLLPGMKYEMPPQQEKTNPFTETESGFLSKTADMEVLTGKTLMNMYSGFSPVTAGEIIYRAERKYGKADGRAVWGEFEAFLKNAENHNYTPVVIIGKEGKAIDFSPFYITEYEGAAELIPTSSISEAQDRFFGEREAKERERQLTGSTEKLLKNIENRLIKKIALQNKELQDTAKKDDFKRRADLITANLYLFKGKERKIKVTEYVIGEDGEYSETETEIELEKGLNASQTAQKLYKKYAKAKNAEKEITKQIELGQTELEYVKSVTDALSRVSGQSELEEIRKELEISGYIAGKEKLSGQTKKKNGQKDKSSVSSPLRFKTPAGTELLVGRNNLQNDYLTFRIADKNDYWFHVKNMPGSHTVLVCNGTEPSQDDLEFAAEVAAYYSKMSDSDKVQVDYTKIRNVKKPSGSRPGYVIYDRYSTATVKPLNPETLKTEREK